MNLANLPWEPNPERGVNPSWIVGGKHFVKAHRKGFGYSLEEQRAAFEKEAEMGRHMATLGAPAVPLEVHEHKGVPVLVGPHLKGWKTLDNITPEHLTRINKDQAAAIIAAEHHLGIIDRHPGNYMYHPKTGEVRSIDHAAVIPEGDTLNPYSCHALNGALYKTLTHYFPDFANHPKLSEISG